MWDLPNIGGPLKDNIFFSQSSMTDFLKIQINLKAKGRLRKYCCTEFTLVCILKKAVSNFQAKISSLSVMRDVPSQLDEIGVSEYGCYQFIDHKNQALYEIFGDTVSGHTTKRTINASNKVFIVHNLFQDVLNGVCFKIMEYEKPTVRIINPDNFSSISKKVTVYLSQDDILEKFGEVPDFMGDQDPWENGDEHYGGGW